MPDKVVRSSRRRSVRAPAAVLGGILLMMAAPAAAQVDTSSSAPGEWTFTIAPYFWLAGLNGKTGVFGQEPVEIDANFGDILENVRFGGMVVGEAHNGTWGIFSDLMFAKMHAEETVTRSVSGVPTTLTAIVEPSSFTGTLMGAYRVSSTPTVTVDVMAGARLWNLDNEIRLTLTQGGPPLADLSGSDGSTWVDPMLGVAARFDLDPSWFVNAWGMIGGFGAGSDLAWDVLVGVGYRWSRSISFVGGYRALGVDYDNDGFVYDVIQHGPFLGAVFRF
jgi:hypothetical protein